MALTFDHSTKRIGVPQADAQPLLVQTIINAIRDEEASERGITYDQIADASGKEALGGSVLTGITLALRSTWALQFAAGAYQASVDGGNLADGLNRVANTGSPQVILRSSSAATLVETGVSGLTAQESADLAAAAAGTDPAAISTAVVTDLHATTIPVNIKKVNDADVVGSGTELDPWGPA